MNREVVTYGMARVKKNKKWVSRPSKNLMVFDKTRKQ